MFKRYVAIPVFSLFLGGACLSLSPAEHQRDNDYPPYVKPGVSAESPRSQEPNRQMNGKRKIAYIDERDVDIHHRANRRGDWGYRENWRYDRKAFYRGETQPEAYNQEHPEGEGGIGFDPDREFLQMRRFYLEESRRNHDNAHVNLRNTRNPRNQQQISYINRQNQVNQRKGDNHSNTENVNKSSSANQSNRNHQNGYQQGNSSAQRQEISYTETVKSGSYPTDDNFKYDWSKQDVERQYPANNPHPYYPYYDDSYDYATK
jgi:hypothetical protein